jgi:hypothetical protein
MFIYWGRRFNSEHVGDRVVRVECDKCACEYFYLLTRIGVGAGTSSYGLNNASVARSAQKQSQRDLERRLTLEAELVPCPSCNWINKDLVRGFRRGRYRKMGVFAAGLGFAGTICSLIVAWFLYIGPPSDRVALPYFLVGGPLLFALFVAGTFLLRTWLRVLIQPNRHFPQVPRLPPGLPRALVKDKLTGEMRPAKTGDPCESVAQNWLDFLIGRDKLPLLCCDCLQSATTEHAYKCRVTATMALEVPRCRRCALRQWRRALCIGCIMAALGLVVGWGASLSIQSNQEFWFCFCISVPIAAAIGAYGATKMTAPVQIAGGERSRGVVRLRFRNADYGVAVANYLSDPDS